MSLFDVIRYPVTDIFSDEINSYPREIMVPWLEYCYDVAGTGKDLIDIGKCQSFSTFAHMLIIRADLDLTDDGKEAIGDRLKEYFTLDLQRRIREYE